MSSFKITHSSSASRQAIFKTYRENLIIWSETWKLGPYAIWEQRRSRRACASVQSVLDFLCSSTYAIISIDSVNGQRRPWSACAYAQADLGLRCPILHKALFVHHMTFIKPAREFLHCLIRIFPPTPTFPYFLSKVNVPTITCIRHVVKTEVCRGIQAWIFFFLLFFFFFESCLSLNPVYVFISLTVFFSCSCKGHG